MTTLRRRLHGRVLITVGCTAVSAVTAPAAHAGVYLGKHCEPLLTDN